MSDFQQPPPGSEQPVPVNPYDSPETVRPGMSSSSKVLIGLGVGCGVLLLLCCGFFGVTAFFFGRSFEDAISKDPATVRRVTESIVTIDVPEDLAPEMSLDWTMPFMNSVGFTMAVYADHDEDSSLVLFQVAEDLGNAEAMQAQFKRALSESGRGQMQEVELEESEEFSTEINGSPTEFTVGSGKIKDSDREVWQATGAFDGNGGPALLFMQVGAEDFTKQQVMETLKSMK